MRLSKRLTLVASFVSKGSRLADIGTDHGYSPIALAEEGTVTKAIAMDVRTGPLERARDHIAKHHLEDRIETRLSDGAGQLEAGEVDTVVIAGMGGELVIHILEGGRHLWDDVSQWVLSPQSELDKVRRFLVEQGFSITREDMVEEDGKYYTVMDVARGSMDEMTQAEYLYGRYLIQHKNPVLREFLWKERDQLQKIEQQLHAQNTDSAGARLKELKEELSWNREAQDEMQ